MPLEQHVIDRFNGANIPPRFHEMRLNAVSGGEQFTKYLNEDYSEDRARGVGIHVWGNSRARAELFPLMARAMALRGDHVYFTQMVVIRDVARSDDHPFSEVIMGCKALFVQFFCTSSEGSPYSLSERADIEHLLLNRAMMGHRNYFSATDSLELCSWWSMDFLESINSCMKGYQVF